MINMRPSKPQLIVALDVDTLEEVRQLMDTLSSMVDIFKVGSQLFTACGPAAVRFILARGKKVFLDLKYHDIPHTVSKAVEAAVNLAAVVKESPQGIFMYTLHTAGGLAMLKEAVEAGTKRAQELKLTKPLALGITVLTSEEKDDNIQPPILEKAVLAKQAGLDGVVISVQETPLIRRQFGNDFIIATPGIRPKGEAPGDQQRIATPAEAIVSGSDYLVVGRPILRAQDPSEATKKIMEEMQAALINDQQINRR